MREKKATHLISPASHDPLDALKKAVLPQQRFFMRKGSPLNHIDSEIKRTKKNPGVGQYDLKKIEKAYDKITLGSGRGWK